MYRLKDKHHKSNSVVIVVHEIYGINEHIKHICRQIAEEGFDVICPNLLDQEDPFDSSEEDMAYHNFMENIGFKCASNKIKRILLDIKEQYQKVYLVGFSIGATVVWLCSELDSPRGIVGYYGSRIRDYLKIDPLCRTMLFFPEKESSFDVDELILNLKKKNLEIHQFNGQHGFSDPYSPNYNKKSANEAFYRLIAFLNNKN